MFILHLHTSKSKQAKKFVSGQNQIKSIRIEYSVYWTVSFKFHKSQQKQDTVDKTQLKCLKNNY